MSKRSLDLGCGNNPKNPFNVEEVYRIDAREDLGAKIFKADLAVDPIPFEDDFLMGLPHTISLSIFLGLFIPRPGDIVL